VSPGGIGREPARHRSRAASAMNPGDIAAKAWRMRVPMKSPPPRTPSPATGC